MCSIWGRINIFFFFRRMFNGLYTNFILSVTNIYLCLLNFVYVLFMFSNFRVEVLSKHVLLLYKIILTCHIHWLVCCCPLDCTTLVHRKSFLHGTDCGAFTGDISLPSCRQQLLSYIHGQGNRTLLPEQIF